MRGGGAALTLGGAALFGVAKATDAAEGLARRGGEKILLQPDWSRDLFRVRIELEVKGNVNVPENPLVSRDKKAELPIESHAELDYEERWRLPEGAQPGSEVTAVERYYHTANSRSQIHRNRQDVTLRPEVRQTVARRDVLPETVYATDDYFNHRELELLEVPASSAAVDHLLPDRPVAVGVKTPVDGIALGSLLNLSSVDDHEVTLELVELDDKHAKLQLRGDLDGSVQGVPTRIRLVGKLTFDQELRCCTWLALAMHETREIGKAEPGFDVAATIKMIRRPLDKPVRLPAEPRPLKITEPAPPERTLVAIQSDEVGVTALMDRRWRMMRDVPGSAMMRMIDHDRSIAQCELRPLATLPAGRQWTLEAFTQDVRRTVGDRMRQLIRADERVSVQGLRVLQVTAQGEVEGVPIQWIMLHFSDDDGRRVLATFVMDNDSLDAFAGSDVQLADSLRLTGPPPAPAEASADDVTVEGEEKLGDLGSSRVAAANDSAAEQVQSASDVR